ncbi:MAG TPA: glutaredoxin family protein [Candidatus Sulfotelmatobacter sp.]|nr:glutaredoxin family protein [Candidatus Sulfotelmatobacter sp.]
MQPHILLFAQPGCLSCEVMRIFLEAKGVAFEERDISSDDAARQEMVEQHGSHSTPTLLISADGERHVIVGFDPDLLDQLLSPDTSSDSVVDS